MRVNACTDYILLKILSYYLIIGFNYVQSLRQGASELLPVMIYHQIFDVVNEAGNEHANMK
jgi:hypothetical protein